MQQHVRSGARASAPKPGGRAERERGSGRLTAVLALCGAVIVAVPALLGSPAAHVGALAAFAALASAVAWLTTRPPFERHALAAASEGLERRIDGAAEQRLDMHLRAETAGRFREEFVAAVRHELKTPLNAILGFTQVLLDGLDGPLTEQQREDVIAIRQAGTYLSELVEAVLEEWVPDRATPLPLGPVDLGLLLREVGRLLEGQTLGKTVAIEVEVERHLPKPLGDARRLRQVLINLGTNALRATTRGSVTLGATRDPEGVRITVRDTGAGIPSEVLPTLFEEFSESGSAGTRLGGSGLGLALTRDLVQWHAGRIEVETYVGEGSSFHVILPTELD